MPNPNYTIRPMNRKEVPLAVDWAAREGWNPGLHDAASYFAADPTGFLVGLLDDQPIAVISAVKYADNFGFLGFYIVHPDYRGQGYGLAIWRAAVESLQGRTIGLDGVVEQQPNYRQSGFQFAYNNVRFVGRGGGDHPSHVELVPLSDIPLDDVLAYDQTFFPADRSAFLQTWITQPEAFARGILHSGSLAGYGVIRPCRSGWKIGPLFADTLEQAETLFLALKSAVPAAAPIYLDIPQINPAALELVERHQMTRVFETARMYAGEVPTLPLDRLYGVTSFEVG